jgi:hypothetical protein
MLTATSGKSRMNSKELKRLSELAALDSDEYLRTFWTKRRICFTLLAVEDLARGNRCEQLITHWFVPFVQYLRVRPLGRTQVRGATPYATFHRFARQHKVSLDSTRAP